MIQSNRKEIARFIITMTIVILIFTLNVMIVNA